MKRLSAIILVSLAVMLFAAPCAVAQGSTSGELEGSAVGHTALSQKDQWHNLRRWVSLTFDHSNVIDMEDAERGTMIIKWSCPVQLPSEFVNATVQMTYVIDVRDGKYRLQKLSPRVCYQLVRADFYDGYDTERANAASADFMVINTASSNLFGGSYDWPVGEQYDRLAAGYLELANSTPQYRNDRDRERGKISDDRRRAEHNWKLVAAPLMTLRQLDSAMTASLDEALRNNDDF